VAARSAKADALAKTQQANGDATGPGRRPAARRPTRRVRRMPGVHPRDLDDLVQATFIDVYRGAATNTNGRASDDARPPFEAELPSLGQCYARISLIMLPWV
jgi:hypothetical protein